MNPYDKMCIEVTRERMDHLCAVRMIGFKRTVNLISACVLIGAVVYFGIHVWLWAVR